RCSNRVPPSCLPRPSLTAAMSPQRSLRVKACLTHRSCRIAISRLSRLDATARLRELADGGTLSADDCVELAVACHQLGLALADTRFIAVEDALRLTSNYWPAGEAGAVSSD